MISVVFRSWRNCINLAALAWSIETFFQAKKYFNFHLGHSFILLESNITSYLKPVVDVVQDSGTGTYFILNNIDTEKESVFLWHKSIIEQDTNHCLPATILSIRVNLDFSPPEIAPSVSRSGELLSPSHFTSPPRTKQSQQRPSCLLAFRPSINTPEQ